MLRLALLSTAASVILTAVALPATAQQTGAAPPLDRGSVISAVLTIDSERLFRESAFGKRVASEIEAMGAELTAENRQIEATLEAEEQELTDRRASLTPEEFRTLADEFDQKVQTIRQAQAAKGRELTALLEKERDVFLAAAAPVLEQLMRESEASVILERRSVFVSASAIEITDNAIALLDETLGSGDN